MTGSAPALEIHGLTKTYSNRPAVDNFSCSVPAGSSLGIVGESGAGKSTIVRCIIGLEKPSAGTIHASGKLLNPNAKSRELRERARYLQYVAQNPRSALDPRMRVDESIVEVLALHTQLGKSERFEKAHELMRLVALPTRMRSSYPSQLSGGQLQRVAIARALAPDPSLLVLDEYVSALDVSVQAVILNLIDNIKETRDLATLVVTHDLAVVRHATDYVVVMKEGRVMEQGPTARVLDDPQDPYTQKLRSATPHTGWEL
ncbi:MAG: ABC transporter ATP-binding protein [Homoserinimonas sp.]